MLHLLTYTLFLVCLLQSISLNIDVRDGGCMKRNQSLLALILLGLGSLVFSCEREGEMARTTTNPDDETDPVVCPMVISPDLILHVDGSSIETRPEGIAYKQYRLLIGGVEVLNQCRENYFNGHGGLSSGTNNGFRFDVYLERNESTLNRAYKRMLDVRSAHIILEKCGVEIYQDGDWKLIEETTPTDNANNDQTFTEGPEVYVNSNYQIDISYDTGCYSYQDTIEANLYGTVYAN